MATEHDGQSKPPSDDTDARPLPRVLALADHLGHPNGKVHGGTTYFTTVYPALAGAGVPLVPVFIRDEHPAAAKLRDQGVEPVFLGRHWADPRAFSDVLKLVDRHDIQLLHLASFQSHAIGRLVRMLRPGSVRSVVHLHDTNPLSSLNRFVQRRLSRYTDAAIVISDDATITATNEYGLPPDRIAKVHNGVDLRAVRSNDPAADRAALRGEWGISDKQPLIGIVARFHPMKGHRYALEAMKRWTLHRPEARLVLVGDGPLRGEIERQVQQLGLQEHVRLVGQRDDIPRVMAAIDVLTVSSTFGESFGLVAVEAMANGRPVVTFACPGVPEVVGDGVGGLVVTKEDTAGMCEAWERLMADQALSARLSEGARHRAGVFTVERHVERLLGVYRWALGQSEKPEQQDISNALPQCVAGIGR